MRAMVAGAPGRPLDAMEMPLPAPGIGQVLVRIQACGVCRTDLHVVDGELDGCTYPIVPGHEIVGRVVASGGDTPALPPGTRVGIPWLGSTCGNCAHCANGRENLCDQARFTGCQIHGGYAEYTVADARYCFPVPDQYSDVEAAPLLCAGLIGLRALRIAGLGGTLPREGGRLGLYGFGAAAHILAQVARFERHSVYAFTRPGDLAAQAFAHTLGAHWVGGADAQPAQALDAAILFAPVGALVPAALRCVRKGGVVVCAGIHMSDIPSFAYSLLWGERVVRSVANLTRADAVEFLALAPRVPVSTQTETFALEGANEALAKLRAGDLQGAAVIVP